MTWNVLTYEGGWPDESHRCCHSQTSHYCHHVIVHHSTVTIITYNLSFNHRLSVLNLPNIGHLFSEINNVRNTVNLQNIGHLFNEVNNVRMKFYLVRNTGIDLLLPCCRRITSLHMNIFRFSPSKLLLETEHSSSTTF